MLINFTNHPHRLWSDKQLSSAVEKWETVVDYPFPEIDPSLGEEDIANFAEKTAYEIIGYCPQAVLCQGEMTMTVAVVSILERHGVKCFAACSQRCTVEKALHDGKTEKKSVFAFVRFRRYPVS